MAFVIAHSWMAQMSGMIEGKGSTNLSPESFQRLRVFGEVHGRKEFQSNETAKLGVLCLIDHPHPAAAEFLDDAVMRDGLADERLGLRHLASILGCGAELSQRTVAATQAVDSPD